MGPLMETHLNNSPVVKSLHQVFISSEFYRIKMAVDLGAESADSLNDNPIHLGRSASFFF